MNSELTITFRQPIYIIRQAKCVTYKSGFYLGQIFGGGGGGGKQGRKSWSNNSKTRGVCV